MKMFGSCAAIACLLLAIGCNKSDTPGVKEDVSSAKPAPAAPLPPPANPDVYVQTLVNSIADGQPKAAWNALPPKYQADLTGLKNEFAGKIDPVVWDKAFAVVAKLGQVLKTKKAMLLATPLVGQAPPELVKMVDANWPTITDVVDDIAQSEIKTHAGLKAADPGMFLENTGTKLFTHSQKIATSLPVVGEQAKIKKVKVSLVKLEGDTATLKIQTEGEPAPPTDDVFKAVDGKWLPAKMVAEWDSTMAEGKAYAADLNIAPELKDMLIKTLDHVSKVLDGMLAAPDQATFDKGVFELVIQFQSLVQPPQTTGPTPAGPTTGGGPTLGGPAIGAGPGSLPPPGSMPQPAATPIAPTLPGSGSTTPPSSSIPSTPNGASGTNAPSGGPSLGLPSLPSAPK